MTDPIPAPPAGPVLGEEVRRQLARSIDEARTGLPERLDGPAVDALVDAVASVVAALLAAVEQRDGAAFGLSGDADPIKAAVEAALRETMAAWWQTPPRLELAADVAVTAHRRTVLDQRDDGEVARIRRQYEERRRLIAARVNFGNASIATTDEDVGALLAALADETAARRQAEAEKASLPEWRCPGCGAVTRARMADHGEDGGR